MEIRWSIRGRSVEVLRHTLGRPAFLHGNPAFPYESAETAFP